MLLRTVVALGALALLPVVASGQAVALDPFGQCGRCGPCTAGRFNYCDTPTRLSGAFAEFCIAPVTNSWLVPKSMDMESAAMLEPFACPTRTVQD